MSTNERLRPLPPLSGWNPNRQARVLHLVVDGTDVTATVVGNVAGGGGVTAQLRSGNNGLSPARIAENLGATKQKQGVEHAHTLPTAPAHVEPQSKLLPSPGLSTTQRPVALHRPLKPADNTLHEEPPNMSVSTRALNGHATAVHAGDASTERLRCPERYAAISALYAATMAWYAASSGSPSPATVPNVTRVGCVPCVPCVVLLNSEALSLSLLLLLL
jgi:hypothetical protein